MSGITVIEPGSVKFATTTRPSSTSSTLIFNLKQSSTRPEGKMALNWPSIEEPKKFTVCPFKELAFFYVIQVRKIFNLYSEGNQLNNF